MLPLSGARGPQPGARRRREGPAIVRWWPHAVLFTALAACQRHDDAVVIGAYLSLSGSDSTFGSETKEGIDLARDQLNAAGGLHGKPVRVVYADDKSTPQEVTNKVRQLIDRDRVIALLGEVASSRSLVGGLLANTKKIPMITPSSTAVKVTKNRAYVFRTCFTDAQQGEVAARFVMGPLGRKRIAVLYVAQDTYSSGLAHAFEGSVRKAGGAIVAEKAYEKGETNFTTYLREVTAEAPDVVFAPIYYTDMVQIARQAGPLGLPGSLFVGGDGWDSQDLLDGAGPELEGAVFTNHYAPDVPWPDARAFLGAYQARYGHPPGSLSAQGYDAARLLFRAIDQATIAAEAQQVPLSTDAVRDAIAATKDFHGATGTLSMDADHNALKPVVLVRIHDNHFTFAGELSAR